MTTLRIILLFLLAVFFHIMFIIDYNLGFCMLAGYINGIKFLG